jgi:hypothetical protein
MVFWINIKLKIENYIFSLLFLYKNANWSELVKQLLVNSKGLAKTKH